MNRVEIIPLERKAAKPATRLLAEAFRDNPFSVHVFDNLPPEKREKKLRTLYAGVVNTCIGHGTARAILQNDEIAGVSLAYPPGSYPLSLWVWAENGLGALFTGPKYTWHLARLDALARKKHLSEKHWYLFVLGVAPHLQGNGLGGRLVAKMSKDADRQSLPCYLETDKPENVGFYSTHGYQVVGEEYAHFVNDLKIWYMMRPAKNKNSKDTVDRKHRG
jgi:ribosomal protein S18 acetylase RimI-like enzyme